MVPLARCAQRVSEMPHFTRAHGYAFIGFASIAMIVQVIIAEAGFAANPHRLAHHAKQLVALIPKLLSDTACVVLLGPSRRAVASPVFLLGGFIGIVLPHGSKAFYTTARYAADTSHEALVGMAQANCTLFIHFVMFGLHRPGGINAWACYRGAHGLVAVNSIAFCVYLRLQTQSAGTDVQFPPLRGSFEGAILTYAAFAALCLWLTPARRLQLHSSLCGFFPWLPLSALKRDELADLLKAEDAPWRWDISSPPPSAPPEVGMTGGTRRHVRRPSSERARDSGWVAGTAQQQIYTAADLLREQQQLCGSNCGASTLGSNSEVDDLASQLPAIDGPAANELRTPSPAYSPAFYQRERALERTLHELGLQFPEDEKFSSHSPSSALNNSLEDALCL